MRKIVVITETGFPKKDDEEIEPESNQTAQQANFIQRRKLSRSKSEDDANQLASFFGIIGAIGVIFVVLCSIVCIVALLKYLRFVISEGSKE